MALSRPILLFLLLALPVLVAPRHDHGEAAGIRHAPGFALLDHRGRLQSFPGADEARAVVLFVHGNGCPIVRNSLSALRRLRAEFGPHGVRFLLINANPQDNRASIASEAREYDVDLPILVDESQVVAEALGIERTAEAIAIDPSTRKIVYRGPIDDRLDYQAQKPRASRHYLAEALRAQLRGEPVDIEPTPVRGCLVAFEGRHRARRTPISYSERIAPLLARRCAVCHRQGGVAPWAMSGHRAVSGWAPMMREVILARRMPPGQIDPHVGRFRYDATLSPEEMRLIVRWIDAGAPRGEGPDPLAALPPPEPGWPLGPPDRVVELDPERIPATGIVDYRYRSASLDLEHDVWVRAAHLRPSNAAVMHHALANVVYPDGASRPAPEGSPWLEGMFAAHAPGREPEAFPEGTGRFLPAGAKLRFQLHYTPTGRPETDRPQLALYFHERPPSHELRVAVAIDWRFEIPPHASHHEVRATHRFERDVLLYAMAPHMHYRGQSFRFEARYPDGSREALLSVPDYQFDWQRTHELVEPKHLPAGTTVLCSGVFDNSARNPRNPDPESWVRWGEQSHEEMFIGYLLYREWSGAETTLQAARAD